MERRSVITPRACYGAELWERIAARLEAEGPTPTSHLAQALGIPDAPMIAILRSLERAGLVGSERRLGTREEPGAYWWSPAPRQRSPRAGGMPDRMHRALDAMAEGGAALVRTDGSSWTLDPRPERPAVAVDASVVRGFLLRHLVSITGWDERGEPVRLELAAPWPPDADPAAHGRRRDGLTDRQRATLGCLDLPMSVSEMAAALGTSFSAAAGIVLSLRRRGLVVREEGRPGVGARYALAPGAAPTPRGPLQERTLPLLDVPRTARELGRLTGSDASYMRALLRRWAAEGSVRQVAGRAYRSGSLYRRARTGDEA